jgi:5'-phosphate synthase pdxT subunit
VEVLAEVDGRPCAVASGRTVLTTFHPELTGDDRIHRYLLAR